MDIEVIIEMTTVEEVNVGQGKDDIQVILEGITSSSSRSGLRASTNRDRIRGFKCRNTIISLKIVQIHKQKRSQNRYNKCII